MPHSTALTKRFPDRHVGHIKLWYPAKDKPGEYAHRAEIEGWLPESCAELILTLAALGHRLPPETEERVVALAAEIRALPWPATETTPKVDA